MGFDFLTGPWGGEYTSRQGHAQHERPSDAPSRDLQSSRRAVHFFPSTVADGERAQLAPELAPWFCDPVLTDVCGDAMKPILVSLCVITSITAIAIALGCPDLQQRHLPCESSLDCPTKYGCNEKMLCQEGRPESVLTVSPAQGDVIVSSSTLFTATIDGRSVDVQWSLDPPDSSVGSIASTGLYTAPGSVPSSGLVVVWASLVRHPELRASVMLRIVPLALSDAGLGPDAGVGPDGGDGGPSGNLVPDPGFESSGETVWTAWGGRQKLQKSTNHPHSGAQCLCMPGSQRAADWAGPVLDLTNRLIPNVVYQVAGWVRIESNEGDAGNAGDAGGDAGDTGGDAGVDAGDAGDARVSVVAIKLDTKWHYSASGGTAEYHNLVLLSDQPVGQWIQFSQSIALPGPVAADPSGTFELYVDGPPPGFDLCIDDVSVQRIP